MARVRVWCGETTGIVCVCGCLNERVCVCVCVCKVLINK